MCYSNINRRFKMKILKTISLVVTLACACSVMAAVANNSGQPKGGSHGPNKHESYSRLMRVTMKDGSTEEFLMESVRNLTFEANPNDSSDIEEKPIDEDPEMPDEPDRTPEARSSSSAMDHGSSAVQPESSETPSSDDKSSDSKSSDSQSSDSKSSDSKSSDSKSSDSNPVDDKSSSSATSSSSSETSSSSSATSSSSAKQSSSSAKSSSSSEKTTTTPTIDYTGTRILWNSKNYTLSIFSRQAGNGSFSLFDTQGAKVGGGNVYVTRGSTSLSLEYLKLAKGNYVVQLEIGNAKIQQTISVLGK